MRLSPEMFNASIVILLPPDLQGFYVL